MTTVESYLSVKLRELCTTVGIETDSATSLQLIERLERYILILQRDLARAKTYGKDPSGRW